MPPVEVPPRPALVTIPGVELLEVGEDWATSTGDFTFTAEDLAAAVAAQDDPAVRSPVVKLGHTDPRFDGEPALGRVINMRTTDSGQTLVGDLVGVPAWLADIMATAFPSRSIEGAYGVTTATGNTHQFLIDGLALLGVVAPAITTLEDIAGLFGLNSVAAGSRPDRGENNVVLRSRATLAHVPPVRVDAAVSTEDVRRAYYEGPGGDEWALWIREVHIDPQELIVTNDETGTLERVAYTIDGDEVTFAEAIEVRIVYQDIAASGVNAGASHLPGTVIFASRAESRPEVHMALNDLRSALGLPESATDEEVQAAAVERLSADPPEPDPAQPAPDPDPEPEPEPAPAPAGVPEGAVLVDASTLAQLQEQAGRGAQAAATLARRDRDAFIGRVASAGRLAPANNDLRASLEREWERDPAAAERVAAQLAVVVPLEEVGHDQGSDSGASAGNHDAVDAYLFPEIVPVRARQNGATGG